MAWIVRGLAFLLSLMVIVNGGYWELHHHLWAGMFMALFGIVSVVVVAGASATHVEQDQIRLE